MDAGMAWAMKEFVVPRFARFAWMCFGDRIRGINNLGIMKMAP
jgi:hypothetical protein